ncbi:hypothetical protein [Paenibacillus xylanexedens]|uniref:hypothetical protein n=1 Tax=Paenibacillus xylanexedens TaxID=528191 RepID=UPI0016425F1D|nr:hypothetical protein [Paenibacillus xylanexedens]
MLKGWICADVEDRDELEEFGIKLGQYNYEDSEFIDCEVSDEAFSKLESLWGKYIWGLH